MILFKVDIIEVGKNTKNKLKKRLSKHSLMELLSTKTIFKNKVEKTYLNGITFYKNNFHRLR